MDNCDEAQFVIQKMTTQTAASKLDIEDIKSEHEDLDLTESLEKKTNQIKCSSSKQNSSSPSLDKVKLLKSETENEEINKELIDSDEILREEDDDEDEETSVAVVEEEEEEEEEDESKMSSLMSNSSDHLASVMSSSPKSSTPLCSASSFHEMPQIITHVGRKPLNGPPCSLKTLVDDSILEPLDGSLTYEIMGAKFFGDLLSNGFIRMSGTTQVFANPSSWANYCRSTIPLTNKDQKHYGSAWSIIRYLGKRLDSYKLRWYRKQKKHYTGGGGGGEGSSPIGNGKESMLSTNGAVNSSNNGSNFSISSPPNFASSNPTIKVENYQIPFSASTLKFSGNVSPASASSSNNFAPLSTFASFNSTNSFGAARSAPFDYKNLFSIINRDRFYKLDKISSGDYEVNAENMAEHENILNFNALDLNSKELKVGEQAKIGCAPFASVFCLQPFMVTISTNVLLLVDFHSHLVFSEVFGYLAGTWDSRAQILTIQQVYPMRFKESKETEEYINKIKKTLQKKNMILAGWYHSHPRTVPQPTIHDIKQQLRYQKQMLKNNDSDHSIDYTPCVGLICSPYYQRLSKVTSLYQMFWVMPVFTMSPHGIGRPMQISYNIARDAFLTQDLLVEMRLLVSFCSSETSFVNFHETFRHNVSYWQKFKESIRNKLPRDLVEVQTQTEQITIQQQALIHFWSFLKNLLL